MKETLSRMIVAACASILMTAAEAAHKPVHAFGSVGNPNAIPAGNDFRSAVLTISIVMAAIIAAILTCFFYRRYAAEDIFDGKQLKKTATVYCLFYFIVMGLAYACIKGLFILTFVLCCVLLIAILGMQ